MAYSQNWFAVWWDCSESCLALLVYVNKICHKILLAGLIEQEQCFWSKHCKCSHWFIW